MLHNFLYSIYFVHALKIEHCAYYAEIILNAEKTFKRRKSTVKKIQFVMDWSTHSMI